MTPLPASIDATLKLLTGQGYVADRSLATVLYLSLRMGRPFCWKARPAPARQRSPRC